MKKIRIILILAVALSMLFAGNVFADETGFTQEDIDLINQCVGIMNLETKISESQYYYGYKVDASIINALAENKMHLYSDEDGQLGIQKDGTDDVYYFKLGDAYFIDFFVEQLVNIGEECEFYLDGGNTTLGEHAGVSGVGEIYGLAEESEYYLFVCERNINEDRPSMQFINSNEEELSIDGSTVIVDTKKEGTGEVYEIPIDGKIDLDIAYASKIYYDIDGFYVYGGNMSSTKFDSPKTVYRFDIKFPTSSSTSSDVYNVIFGTFPRLTDAELDFGNNDIRYTNHIYVNKDEVFEGAFRINSIDDYYDFQTIIQNKLDTYGSDTIFSVFFIDYDVPSTGKIEVETSVPKNKDDGIEEVLADFLTLIGKLLIACSNWAAGQNDKSLTLDSIVFDRFEPLKLNFFRYGPNGEESNVGDGLSSILVTPINRMFSLFRSMAIMGYMVILVYIGIKMMLSSTTAKKKATYKDMFSYWVVGIAILFFFPYVMKYTIELNSALVKSIGSTTKEVESTTINTANAEYSSPYVGKINEMLKYTEDGKKDYLSQIGYLAQQTKKLGVAIAYVVLCWQLLMMLVYYYKRVFVVAFLIMVFPLIAFMYVWDKLNDGKSQSFSAWTKEFMVAVFVQSIHAIVYVFVTNSIYGIIGQGNMDFILLVCASSFMFSGEEILKQILAGGDTVAMGSVAQTGKKVLAVTKLAQVAGTKIIKNVVGKDGLVRGTYRNLRNAKMHRLMNTPVGGNDDKTGKTPFDLMSQNKTMNSNIAPYLPKEGKITPNIRAAAESVFALNNADTQSIADLAKARKEMERLMKMTSNLDEKNMTDEEKKLVAIMQQCKFTPQQFNAMNNAVLAGVAMQNVGEKTVNITQHLQLEFEMIFPETDPVTGKKEVANKMLKATMMDVAARGKSHEYTSKDVDKDWERKVQRVSEYDGKVKLSNKRSSIKGDKDVEKKVKARSTQIFDSLKKDIPDFDSKTKEEKQALREFSYSLATLQTVKNDTSYDVEFYRKNLDVLKGDYGSNQAIISKYISDHHIDVVALDSMIRNSRKETILNNRVEGLLKQYEGQYGPIEPSEREELQELARKIVPAEQVETGEFNATDMYNAVTGLDNSNAKVQALLRLSNLEMDIDSLKAMLALKIQEESDARRTTSADEEAVKWAHKTVREARKKQNENDPLTSIYDILGMTYEDGKSNRISDLVGRATINNDKVRDFLDKKADAAKLVNRNEIMQSEEMAKAVLKELGVHKRDMKESDQNGEYTYRGYTKEEIKQLGVQERLQGNIGLVRGITAIPATLLTTVAGAAIGAAASDDGMPLGEMFTGAVSGFNLGDSLVNGTELGITNAMAKHDKSSLEKAAAERIQGYKAADEANKEKTENSKAEKPEIVSLYGALCQGGDGTLYVDINITAKNAVMMSAGENLGSAGTGWLPYDSHMNYVLDDQSKNKKHTVFVRIKGPKGDIKIGKIVNLSIS